MRAQFGIFQTLLVLQFSFLSSKDRWQYVFCTVNRCQTILGSPQGSFAAWRLNLKCQSKCSDFEDRDLCSTSRYCLAGLDRSARFSQLTSFTCSVYFVFLDTNWAFGLFFSSFGEPDFPKTSLAITINHLIFDGFDSDLHYSERVAK